MRLANKISVVTGAGSGQGRAVAQLFATEGSTVVANDVDTDNGEETVELIKKAGGKSEFIRADVSSNAEVKKMMDLVEMHYGQLDVLYNNAGIRPSNLDATAVQLEEDDWDRIIDINLKGVFLCCKYGIALMLKKGYGSVINVSSVAGYAGDETNHAYAASKGGIISFTRSLAMKYGRDGIRANVLCPGMVVTPMISEFFEDEADYERWQNMAMLKRIGKPEEIAYTALFLASDEASFATGSIFTIDGGLMK